MAKPQIVLFHEALYRIVCARGLIGDRAEKARTAIGRYVRVLERAARLGSDAAGIGRRMVDGKLIELEDKLQQWKLLGSETALVCDAALAVVTRERVENLWDRRIAEVLPQPDAPRGAQSTGLLAK
jgi:hypothetical protein